MAFSSASKPADCTGVNPISTKLLAFALGASFSGFAGSVYAAKLQAITPGAFEFNVSIMLLCMVILGGMGSIPGVIAGGVVITLFDRIFLTQLTNWTHSLGHTIGVSALTTVDFTLWRWELPRPSFRRALAQIGVGRPFLVHAQRSPFGQAQRFILRQIRLHRKGGLWQSQCRL